MSGEAHARFGKEVSWRPALGIVRDHKSPGHLRQDSASVPHACDQILRNPIYLPQFAFDLRGEKMVSRGGDHIIFAPQVMQEAVLIQAAIVARHEPPVAKAFLVKVWTVPVALRLLAPAKINLTLLVRRRGGAIVSANGHLDPWTGLPDGVQLARITSGV